MNQNNLIFGLLRLVVGIGSSSMFPRGFGMNFTHTMISGFMLQFRTQIRAKSVILLLILELSSSSKDQSKVQTICYHAEVHADDATVLSLASLSVAMVGHEQYRTRLPRYYV